MHHQNLDIVWGGYSDGQQVAAMTFVLLICWLLESHICSNNQVLNCENNLHMFKNSGLQQTECQFLEQRWHYVLGNE
jgi:hypothetical protein